MWTGVLHGCIYEETGEISITLQRQPEYEYQCSWEGYWLNKMKHNHITGEIEI